MQPRRNRSAVTDLRQRFRGNASDNLKVIERFSRVDEETILYEFTVDDPTAYAEP